MDRVILAFERERTAERIREIIEGAGVAGCRVCHSAAEVKRLVNKQHFTTVVSGYKLRDESADALAEDLPEDCSLLVIAPQNLLDLLNDRRVFRLSAPVSRGELLSSVRILLQFGYRTERPGKPWRSDEELALIDAAKELLIARNSMTEEEAHRFLQKKSMDSGIKLSQAAQKVLDGSPKV